MKKDVQEQQPSRAGHKKGGNKGIAKANRERKRAEAEARNAATPIERTRAYREGRLTVEQVDA